MLWLKRNTRWNELMKCDISGEFIAPGDYYYIDDVDGLRVKATVYKDLKEQMKEETWDYSKINNAANEAEYRKMVQEATRRMLGETVLNRKVAGTYGGQVPPEEDEIIEDIYDMRTGGKYGRDKDNDK